MNYLNTFGCTKFILYSCQVEDIHITITGCKSTSFYLCSLSDSGCGVGYS